MGLASEIPPAAEGILIPPSAITRLAGIDATAPGGTIADGGGGLRHHPCTKRKGRQQPHGAQSSQTCRRAHLEWPRHPRS